MSRACLIELFLRSFDTLKIIPLSWRSTKCQVSGLIFINLKSCVQFCDCDLLIAIKKVFTLILKKKLKCSKCSWPNDLYYQDRPLPMKLKPAHQNLLVIYYYLFFHRKSVRQCRHQAQPVLMGHVFSENPGCHVISWYLCSCTVCDVEISAIRVARYNGQRYMIPLLRYNDYSITIRNSLCSYWDKKVYPT